MGGDTIVQLVKAVGYLAYGLEDGVLVCEILHFAVSNWLFTVGKICKIFFNSRGELMIVFTIHGSLCEIIPYL